MRMYNFSDKQTSETVKNSQRFIALVRLNTHLSQTQDTVLLERVKTTSMEKVYYCSKQK